VRAWPTAIQLVVLVVVADLTQYWVHRAFRRILVLWRFHAIHHSAEQMDWLGVHACLWSTSR
jgi:sterol desaturase/sphingolipid hydroxylase (fatty acid hydroxylase superfamily)